jgi:hypothetical protein
MERAGQHRYCEGQVSRPVIHIDQYSGSGTGGVVVFYRRRENDDFM